MARIVVIDDSGCVRGVLRRVLAQAEHQVLEADTAATGRRLLAAHTAELLIADIQLPDADGIALMVEIREAYPTLPLIVVSGLHPLEIDARSAAAGLHEAVWPLSKPFVPEELLTAVKAALAG